MITQCQIITGISYYRGIEGNVTIVKQNAVRYSCSREKYVGKLSVPCVVSFILPHLTTLLQEASRVD
jgi:hypothetical protein